ncbi:MAG: hypothetical protein GEV07_07425 [Streptosporangiales bacterium]|nr:hypothetical protein [Streptosporangiales bacterium]
MRFAGYTGQRQHFESRGFAFTVLERANAAYRVDEPPERVMAALVEGVWASPEHLADVADLSADQPYDALVVDCTMFGVLAAAENATTPTAVLVHSAPGAILPPHGWGESMMLGAVNQMRQTAGLPDVDTGWATWTPFPVLATSIRDLDPLAAQAPASFGYVGPVSERTRPSGDALPWQPGDRRPLVVASFSTGYAWDQRSRIERTLHALADGDGYRVLALTAMADTAGLDVPPNAALRTYLPHTEVLPEAAVVVTHAGHGTVTAALAHGVPLVCLPNPAADQPALAARVAALGAGIALDGETATADEIGAAVHTVGTDPSYRAAAEKLAAAIAGAPGAAGAADTLEHLAATRDRGD